MADSSGPVSEWKSTRFYLAIGVTLVSIIGVTVLAWAVIRLADQTQGQRAQNVLSTVLPLLGTWVGTILAFYFSKENFEAATRGMTALADKITSADKLKSLAAKQKMIPMGGVFKMTLPADENKALVDLLKEMDEQKKGRRLPVFSEDFKPTMVIHRSTIDQYLVKKLQAEPRPDVKTLTLKKLIEDIPASRTSIATVKEDATLADAKAAMAQVDDCQDVFVTKTGKKDSEAMGWVTNVIIQDNSEV